MKFKSGSPDETTKDIFENLESLRQKNLGILEMVHGSFTPSPNGKDFSRGYTHGLVVTFGSLDDRDRYNVDPDHQKILTQDILPNLEGGQEGLLRFDFVEATG
jgi:hypothetical protein